MDRFGALVMVLVALVASVIVRCDFKSCLTIEVAKGRSSQFAVERHEPD